MTHKGILLAGGKNSRLYPSTKAVAKSLLPIYDKPLIYYSLVQLMYAGIRDILIITTPEAQAAHRQLLGSGEQWGVSFTYATQQKPRGIADAFIIGKSFIAGNPSMLILCDNIFHGSSFPPLLQQAKQQSQGACVFACPVEDPQRFGVVEFDADGRALSLEEKPPQPKSSYAVTGCYFYDHRVCDYAASLAPSARGELEITDINRLYLANNALTVQQMADDIVWFDTGTPDSMATAADYIRHNQQTHNTIIACPEEISWRQGWIDDNTLLAQAQAHQNTAYGDRLAALLHT